MSSVSRRCSRCSAGTRTARTNLCLSRRMRSPAHSFAFAEFGSGARPVGRHIGRIMSLRKQYCLSRLALPFAALCLLETFIARAWAAGVDGAASNFLWLAVILLASNIAARLVERVRLPGVLGELLVGVVMGNLVLVGIAVFDPLKQDPIIEFA